MQLRCNECGKPVSSEVPDDTVVRAWLTCPECIEQGKGIPANGVEFSPQEITMLVEFMTILLNQNPSTLARDLLDHMLMVLHRNPSVSERLKLIDILEARRMR